MKQVRGIVFRYLTDADFFNMYKPAGTEAGGGGQLYIDFRTSTISVDRWRQFFSRVQNLREGSVRRGPEWEFPIHSIGLPEAKPAQHLRVYQRRAASVCIPNQNINTRNANRVRAWHPSRGFAEPEDPANRHAVHEGLVVYLVRTYDDDIWAGWFSNDLSAPSPCQDARSARLLQEMLTQESRAGDVGFLSFAPGTLSIDETNAIAPFRTQPSTRPLRPTAISTTGSIRRTRVGRPPRSARERIPRQRRQRTEDEIVESLFREDEDCPVGSAPALRETLRRTRRRNQNAVRDLKELYQHECQITGSEFTFPKRDGIPYTEIHHLIPLGRGGADDPRNMIVVSAQVHRMLHHAHVSGVDLSQIRQNPDGSASLTIRVNRQDYTISWKPQHAARVLRHQHQTTG